MKKIQLWSGRRAVMEHLSHPEEMTTEGTILSAESRSRPLRVGTPGDPSGPGLEPPGPADRPA